MKTLSNRLDELEDFITNYSDELDALEEALEELKVLSSVDPEEDARILRLLAECEDAITDLILSTNILDP